MAIYRYGSDEPSVPATAWVADNATVLGRVRLGERCSVWYGSVLRADNDWIIVGDETNIQDGSILHVDPGVPLTLGTRVSVGHQCMLHGCSIGDGTLVGMQAVVLNGARIGRNCIVGAGSVVTQGKEFPDGALIVGTPAKLVRMLDAAEVANALDAAARYVDKRELHRSGAVRIDR